MTTAGSGEGIELDCILGRCDSLRAEVYFRVTVPAGSDPAAAKLSGQISGPDCKHAITLPATAELRVVRGTGDVGAADALVARAILTEPSSWTPELPSLYRLDARLTIADREVATWQRRVGLRRAGVRGRSLWLDGRRHVPRGLVVEAGAVDIAAFRTAALTAAVADPSDDLLGRCDAEGVAVIGLLADEAGRPLDVQAAAAAIARWARHPAVLVAVIPLEVPAAATAAIVAAARGRKDTLLVGQETAGGEPPAAIAEGIDVVLVTLPAGGLPHDAWRSSPPAVPLLARRPDRAVAGEPSRRACEALQASLAGWRAAGASWDWAGYLAG